METVAEKLGIVYNSPNVRSWKDEGHFVIPDVAYRGQTGTYRLFEQMTPAMNQAQTAVIYEIEKQKGNPYPTDAPLIWAIITRGYVIKNQNPEASEKLRQFLGQGFRRYPGTLTRIAYEPSEKDKIIHNYKTSDEYSIDTEVVGPDDFVQNISDKKVLESLLGTQDIARINEVSQWVNGTNGYLWRSNSKPEKKEERVAGFYAGDDRFGLDCGRDPRDEYPAFRVLKVE